MRINIKLKDAIEKIVESNCRDIPYEGTEVNKYNITKEICLSVRFHTLQRDALHHFWFSFF